MMTFAIKSRWFRFSLRTLFAAITVFAIWLGWNMQAVRARFAMYDLIVERGGSTESDASTPRKYHLIIENWESMQSGGKLPTCWWLLGARPIGFIDIRRERFSAEELREIKRLFPESDIAAWYYTFDTPSAAKSTQ